MGHSIRALLCAALFSALAGCATMADVISQASDIGVVSVQHSTFDNATAVTLSPAFLYDPASPFGLPVKLGAHWSSAAPEWVALVFEYDSNVDIGGGAYINIGGLDIRVDGDLSTFAPGAPTHFSSSGYNTVSHTIYTSSSNQVVIPLMLLRKMVASHDCRLRIHTGDGYEDAVFSIERIPGGQGTALIPMRNFLAKVDTTLGTH